jgi:hypothetical protein
MPPRPTVTQIRLNNITTCLTISANTLEILASSLKIPFLAVISNTTQSLLKKMQVHYRGTCHNHKSQSTWQTVRHNKNDCTQLLEQTYELLSGILMVHINSDTGAELPPSVLTHIGRFTEYVTPLRRWKTPSYWWLLSGPSRRSTHLLKLNRMVA